MVRLDGSCDIESRENAIRRFSDESDPVRILLLCSKAGGTGLTLTSATRMILIDVDWNPSNEEQVMARIHRAGQRNPVAIYRLLAGWVEEAMLARQIDKEKLADFALDGGGLELFGGFSEENEFRTVLKGKRKLEDESLVPVDLEDRLELSATEEGIIKFFERVKVPPAKPSKFHQIMAEIRENESKSLLASAPQPPVPSAPPVEPSPSRENRIRRLSALDSLSKPDAQDLKKTRLEDRLFPDED